MDHCYSEVPPLCAIPKPIVSSSHKERQDSNCQGSIPSGLAGIDWMTEPQGQLLPYLGLGGWREVSTPHKSKVCQRSDVLGGGGFIQWALEVSASKLPLIVEKIWEEQKLLPP